MFPEFFKMKPRDPSEDKQFTKKWLKSHFLILNILSVGVPAECAENIPRLVFTCHSNAF